ncbi:MAG: sigma-54-dependent Fis family transcriptional regulator, partial [Desulfobacteraceae bacterium]|nr:sigma-54-dependent Fis family transcriptional regulator [Desulfobacteraceae bacterium]
MKNNIESNILIIDDDEGVVQAMSTFIEKMGYKMESAFTLKDGLDKIYSSGFDIILLDVNLPDGSGLSIIDEVLALPVSPQIIIMTGFSDPDGAQLAIESGAWDYIEKPASLKKLKLQISRALEFQKQKKRSALPFVLKSNNIIGRGRAITQCLEKASQFATSEANVLITGKTGTGKELFARVIHDNSMRKNNNFVV